MKARGFDPLRLDVAAFAEQGAQLDGDWPMPQLVRLAGAAAADAPVGEADRIRWHARGELRPVRGGPPQVWLHLQAETRIALECQRCLQPVAVPIEARRSFLFVHGEETAAALDADSEDDVLALTRALDLQELLEDELLLSLPLIARHDQCEPPAIPATDDGEPLVDAPHPFAALAALKGKPRPN